MAYVNRSLIALILIIVLTIPSSYAAEKHVCDGALGFKWEDNFLQVATTAISENNYKYKWEIDLGRKFTLAFDGIVSNNKSIISFDLFDDKLYYILISFSGNKTASDFNELKEYCVDKYGKPFIEDATSGLWFASTSSGEQAAIFLLLEKNKLYLSYTNDKLSAAADEYNKEMNKEYLKKKYKNL